MDLYHVTGQRLSVVFTVLLVINTGLPVCRATLPYPCHEVPDHTNGTGICCSVRIRHPSDLKKLCHCSMVQGHLHFLSVNISASSFPRLKEVSHHLLIYKVAHQLPFQEILPGLQVIRGARLFHNYALVVVYNHGITGTLWPSLKCIARGGVRFQDNGEIDQDEKSWNDITYTGVYYNYFQSSERKNSPRKDYKGCKSRSSLVQSVTEVPTHFCEENLPTNLQTSSKCWSESSVHTAVRDQMMISDLFDGQTCTGTVVDSLEDLENLSGCEVIHGNLTITLSAPANLLSPALLKVFFPLHEVTGILTVANTKLADLDFLRNIRRIGGKDLHWPTYCLIIRDNPLLQRLPSEWRRNNLGNTFGQHRALIANNPNLCVHFTQIYQSDFSASLSVESSDEYGTLKLRLKLKTPFLGTNNTKLYSLEGAESNQTKEKILLEDSRSFWNRFSFTVYYTDAPGKTETCTTTGPTEKRWHTRVLTPTLHPPLSEVVITPSTTSSPISSPISSTTSFTTSSSTTSFSSTSFTLRRLAPLSRYAIEVQVVGPEEKMWRSAVTYATTAPSNPPHPPSISCSSDRAEKGRLSLQWPHENPQVTYFRVRISSLQLKGTSKSHCPEDRSGDAIKGNNLKQRETPTHNQKSLADEIYREASMPSIEVKMSPTTTRKRIQRLLKREKDYFRDVCTATSNITVHNLPSVGPYLVSIVACFTNRVGGKNAIKEEETTCDVDGNSLELCSIVPSQVICSLENQESFEKIEDLKLMKLPKPSKKLLQIKSKSLPSEKAPKVANNDRYEPTQGFERSIRGVIEEDQTQGGSEEGGEKWEERRRREENSSKNSSARFDGQEEKTLSAENSVNFFLTWKEPSDPGGPIAAYFLQMINYKAMLSTSQCLTVEEYLAMKRVIPVGDLPAGETLLSVRAVLAGGKVLPSSNLTFNRSPNFSPVKSGFGFPNRDSENSSGDWFLFLKILGLPLVLCVAFFLVLWKTKRMAPKQVILSSSMNCDEEVFKDICTYAKEYFENDDILLDCEDVKTGSTLTMIGNGNYSVVYEGYHHQKIVALKCPTKRITCRSDIKEFFDQANFSRTLRSPHVIELIGVLLSSSCIALVMPCMKQSLQRYLVERNSSLTHQEMFKLTTDACLGLEYLEKKNIIHRDISSRNCLVDWNQPPGLKISDLERCKYMDPKEPYLVVHDEKNPIHWQAPETLRYHHYTHKTDVFSFGILIWEIMNNADKPYKNRMSSRENNLTTDHGFAIMEAHLYCTEYSPAMRPTFRQLLTFLCFEEKLRGSIKKLSMRHSILPIQSQYLDYPGLTISTPCIVKDAVKDVVKSRQEIESLKVTAVDLKKTFCRLDVTFKLQELEFKHNEVELFWQQQLFLLRMKKFQSFQMAHQEISERFSNQQLTEFFTKFGLIRQNFNRDTSGGTSQIVNAINLLKSFNENLMYQTTNTEYEEAKSSDQNQHQEHSSTELGLVRDDGVSSQPISCHSSSSRGLVVDSPNSTTISDSNTDSSVFSSGSRLNTDCSTYATGSGSCKHYSSCSNGFKSNTDSSISLTSLRSTQCDYDLTKRTEKKIDSKESVIDGDIRHPLQRDVTCQKIKGDPI